MTRIRITHRTVLEPDQKYPIESIVVYSACLYLKFRKRQSALDMFKKIKLLSKGSLSHHARSHWMRAEIYVDPVSFFKKAAGTVIVSNPEVAVELLHRCISRKSFRNVLDALQMSSYKLAARWPYDSSEDFERLKDNVITHYFRKHYP
jgi:hypothetical protein